MRSITTKTIDVSEEGKDIMFKMCKDEWLKNIKNIKEGLEVLIDTDTEYKAICKYESSETEIHIFK